MSVFYQSLPYKVQRSFKSRKQQFKKNKPCAICGKLYSKGEMMVAHKRPVSELTDWEALYDTKNWEVRCIYCERQMNLKNDIIKKRRNLEEKGGDNGDAQVEQSRCSEEEVHGAVCQNGGEQKEASGEDETRQP